MKSISKKTVLVTGAASGLGKGCAIKFAKEGYNVVIADINIDAAEEVVKEIKSFDGSAISVEMNVASEESVELGIKACIDNYGSIDILVSNAGIQIVHPIEDYPFDEWKKMMAIHADGAFLTSRAAYKYMKESGKGGKIIFMGSAHSHVGSKLKSPYCFVKHGLLGLCRVLAKEGADYGIHTYVVCPGFVKTPLVEKQIPEQSQALGISEDEVIKTVMLKDTVDGTFTTIDDIANAMYYLSTDNGAMTGQSIVLSHGWHMN